MLDEKLFDLLKGSTILDPEVFQKKNQFFYNTSYDILIKGDLGNTAKYLDIFQEFEKKARITPIKNCLPNSANKTKRNKRNILYHNGSFGNSLSNKENKMLKTNKSQSFLIKTKDLNSSYNQNLLLEGSLRNTRASSVGHSFDKYKMNGSLKKTNHNNIKGKTQTSSKINKQTIKILNDKSPTTTKRVHSCRFTSLKTNSKIAKLVYNKPSNKIQEKKKNSFVSDRERTLQIFRDYFKTKQYNQIKSRYIQLFGNETFSQRIKKANNRLLNDSPTIKGEKTEYIRVLNSIDFQAKQKTSNKKYESIGVVKVLNVPIDFYNSHDIYYNEDKSLFAQNAKQLYSIDNKAEIRMKKYSAYLSQTKSIQSKSNNPLTMILKKFKEFETKGIKIKSQILDLRQYLCKKSPIIDEKIFAYIDEDLKLKLKNHHHCSHLHSTILHKSHSDNLIKKNKKAIVLII